MTTEIVYPIRGTRWGRVESEYYYIEECMGLRLGDTVRVEPTGREGTLVTIARLIKPNKPDYFVGVIRIPDRAGSNGYATELGSILGIPNYDNHTHGHDLRNLVSTYSGPCRGCISTCKGEERCVFYREELDG